MRNLRHPLSDNIMNVIYVKAARTKGYLKLRVSDGKENTDLVVSEREYAEAGSPQPSENLTREALSALLLADMRYRASLKALRVLEYGDNSERMLVLKLRRAGISREVAEETAREMVMRGFVNDRRQLARLVLSEAKRLQGPQKFIPKLISKGYSRSDIEVVLDELSESGELDLASVREQLLSRYPDISYEERMRLLYKNGFGNS